MTPHMNTPEWVAAFALLIQAAILTVHGVIMNKHAGTLEKHAEIAKTQADTAKLIANALDQQGKMLDEQTKLMSTQLTFQKVVEAKSEKDKVLEAVMDAAISLRGLKKVLESLQPLSSLKDSSETAESLRDLLRETTMNCQKVLLTAVYLPQDEKQYFISYIRAVSDLKQNLTNDIVKDLQMIAALQDEYKDFLFPSILFGFPCGHKTPV